MPFAVFAVQAVLISLALVCAIYLFVRRWL
jgi:hypothetical protein